MTDQNQKKDDAPKPGQQPQAQKPPQDQKPEQQSQEPLSKTPDTEAADRSGVSEGEIKALRDDAGLNGLAGHQANVHAWENSDEGKEFIKKAKDTSEAEKAAKAAHEPLDKDGKSEAEKDYEETVEG